MEAYSDLRSFDEWSNLVKQYEDDWDSDIVFHHNMTLLDVAYEIANECYDLDNILGHLTCYFDYNAFARDLSYDGYTETEHGVIEIR